MVMAALETAAEAAAAPEKAAAAVVATGWAAVMAQECTEQAGEDAVARAMQVAALEEERAARAGVAR